MKKQPDRLKFFKASLFVVFTLLVSFITVPVVGQTHPLDAWNWRNPYPAGGGLKGIAYGENIFVAAGSAGTITVSSDAVNWTTQPAVTDEYFNGVAFGNSTFVTVGLNGVIISSPDGLNWTVRSSGTSEDLNGITYGGSFFIAVGENGTILTSPDGTTWTPRASGTTENLQGICYGGGLYVATGDSGTILTSAGGTSWTPRVSGISVRLYDVEYGNSLFVSVGRNGTILTSPNGIAWTPRTSAATLSLYDVYFGDGLFLAAGNDGMLITSSDGINWTARISGTHDSIYGIARSGDRFAAVIIGTSITEWGPVGYGKVLYSTDGTDWTTVSSLPSLGTSMRLAFGNSLFCAVTGEGSIYTSPDGQNWTPRTISSPLDLYGIDYGNSLFVAVGEDGRIVTSPDGIAWTERTSGSSEYLNDVTFGGSLWVAVGDNGEVLSSPDGINWTVQTSGISAYLFGVSYNGSIFTAVGEFGAVITSPDGVNWTIRNSGTFNDLYDITFGNSILVAVGDLGTVITSNDGINWNGPAPVTPESLEVVGYGNGVFVAAGFYGVLLTSTDGSTWTSHAPGVNDYFLGMAYGNSRFVAVGYDGHAMVSGDGISWTNATGKMTLETLFKAAYGHAGFAAIGEYGNIFISPDGQSWTPRKSEVLCYFIGMDYCNSTYIAVGDFGRMSTSADGLAWTPRTTGTSHPLCSTAYGNSLYVSVGMSGTILTSSNLATWTPQTSGTGEDLYDIVYAGSLFVAVGDNGTILTSPDGLVWTPETSGTGDILESVIYGENIFVTVGEHGTILTSPDGSTWTPRSSGGAFYLLGIAYGDSTFTAVGPFGAVYSSPDGIAWTRRSIPTDQDLYGVTYGLNTFVCVGFPGQILQSRPLAHTITGNAGSAGVVLFYDNNGSQSIFAGQNGDYSITVPANWSGTITPWFENYVFTPMLRQYDTVTQNYVNQNFTAVMQAFTISGTVTRDGQPESGVTVTFSHDNYSVVTGTDGYYSYSVPAGTSTVITASHEYYTITPTSIRINAIGQNEPGRNFTVSGNNPFTVEVISPTDGATISGIVTVEAVAASDGNSITRVDFYIDGEAVKQDTMSRYQYRWDTVAISNGSHSVMARAHDSTGNTAEHQLTVTVSNTDSPASIEVDHDRLNYGAVINDSQTGPQSILIDNGGGGTFDWTAAPSQSWIIVSPLSGISGSRTTVSVNTAGLSPGTYTGMVQISSTSVNNSPVTVKVYLTVLESRQEQPLFGSMDLPVNGTSVSGSIPVSGWVLDDVDITSVKIYRHPIPGNEIDLVYIGDAILVEGARPDVENLYPDSPFQYRAGWGYMLLTYGLPAGDGPYTLTAIGTDSSGNAVSLGSRDIIVENGSAVKPFGAIDTPNQGGEASGSEYLHQGWALTPRPNGIPADGSTITVWIDGVPLQGHPVYNRFRQDIAQKFPGYANSGGAGGYVYLDTTMYANGVHTISWSVTDDAGNTDGIGSRFFTIYNGQNRYRRANVVPTVSNPGTPDIKAGFSPGQSVIYALPNEAVVAEPGKPVKIVLTGGENNGFISAHLNRNGAKRPLPAGSAFDAANGVFYWQPGPGFSGRFLLVFTYKNSRGQTGYHRLTVTVQPR